MWSAWIRELRRFLWTRQMTQGHLPLRINKKADRRIEIHSRGRVVMVRSLWSFNWIPTLRPYCNPSLQPRPHLMGFLFLNPSRELSRSRGIVERDHKHLVWFLHCLFVFKAYSDFAFIPGDIVWQNVGSGTRHHIHIYNMYNACGEKKIDPTRSLIQHKTVTMSTNT